MTTTAAPTTARAKLKGMVTIGGQLGDTILITLDVPMTVWLQVDAPEDWVGTLSAVKRVRVGNLSMSFWTTTYDTAGNDMEIEVNP
jgi:hypothetical protein